MSGPVGASLYPQLAHAGKQSQFSSGSPPYSLKHCGSALTPAPPRSVNVHDFPSRIGHSSKCRVKPFLRSGDGGRVTVSGVHCVAPGRSLAHNRWLPSAHRRPLPSLRSLTTLATAQGTRRAQSTRGKGGGGCGRTGRGDARARAVVEQVDFDQPVAAREAVELSGGPVTRLTRREGVVQRHVIPT
jgi:hypothetical protein